MPELPEVETIRADLSDCLLGRKIISCQVTRAGILRGPVKIYRQLLVGAKVKAVERRGKLLLLRLSNDYTLAIHLKMTGQIVVVSPTGDRVGGHPIKGVSQVPNRFTHVTLTLTGKVKLYFNDVRRFGYWLLVLNSDLPKLLRNYGPEPLSPNFTVQQLAAKLKRRRGSSIKAALLDQTVVAGIGNIYADESLFVAGVQPDRRAGELLEEEIKKLHQAVKTVLRRAVRARGTSFNSYVDGRGRRGTYWERRLVYGRQNEPCLRCGRLISKTRIAGRGTHYCQHCQK